ncbi:MAG: signal peptidase I [Phyllobacteriaceae bacterium]|jgi:signal peptidase I|nr:signal peptidase I [Phyllobacteriaceae bacterium]
MPKEDHTLAAQRSSGRKQDEGLWETAKVIIQALAIAFFVRTFFYQPFNIPSSSMYPTLKVGDYLFVSKLSYGYGKYSFNFALGMRDTNFITCCPVDFAGRKVLADTPKRGDVAVFKLPTNTEVDYIKRVIGLPGDRVQMKDGTLYINDTAVPKERIEDYVDSDDEGGGGVPVPQFKETLPNGVTYTVLDSSPQGGADNTDVYVVPENHYFMMGDNRDNSQDSRYLDVVGYVPIENFVGRADIIFFSISPDAVLWRPWEWPFLTRWLRFFNLI